MKSRYRPDPNNPTSGEVVAQCFYTTQEVGSSVLEKGILVELSGDRFYLIQYTIFKNRGMKDGYPRITYTRLDDSKNAAHIADNFTRLSSITWYDQQSPEP